MKEDHTFWSNGRVQIKETNQWGAKFLVEWLCTRKEKIKKDHILLSKGRVQIKK